MTGCNVVVAVKTFDTGGEQAASQRVPAGRISVAVVPSDDLAPPGFCKPDHDPCRVECGGYTVCCPFMALNILLPRPIYSLVQIGATCRRRAACGKQQRLVLPIMRTERNAPRR